MKFAVSFIFIMLLLSNMFANTSDTLGSNGSYFHSTRFYLSNGFYHYNTIDEGRYGLKNFQLSYSLIHSKRVGEFVRLKIGSIYTDSRFLLTIDTFAIKPVGIREGKIMAYLDIGPMISFNFYNKPELQISLLGSYLSGVLVKGRSEVVDIYDISYYDPQSVPDLQFNSLTTSTLIGLELDGAISKRISWSVKGVWRHYFTTAIPNEKTSKNSLNVMVGFGYSFQLFPPGELHLQKNKKNSKAD